MVNTPVTAELPSAAGAQPPRAAARAHGGGLAGAVQCEWTKLWSVGSTWVSLASSVALVAFYAVISGVSRQSQDGQAATGASSSPPGTAAVGVLLMGQFAIVTLATLVIASEYSTGSIRSTLQWIPRRARMLLAKSIVIVPVLLAAGVLLGLVGTVVARLALGSAAAPASVSTVLGTALGIGGYLALTGVLVIGLGAAVRSVAGTLTVVFLLILILPMGLQASDVRFLVTLAEYFPGSAGMVLMGTAEHGFYGRPVAVVVLAAWALLCQLVGYAVLRARDA
jgi:ABC-2 type transport system permease protein